MKRKPVSFSYQRRRSEERLRSVGSLQRRREIVKRNIGISVCAALRAKAES
jgi:hypothetical protein